MDQVIVIKGLTKAEKFFISRNRRELTQAEMADELGVTRNYYNAVECSRGLDTDLDPPNVEPLSDLEACVILRRRADISQEELATILECSRYWINRMEQGSEKAEKLIDYWRGRNAAGH